MWDIEVNIAGYRFTSQAPEYRRVLRVAAARPSWWPSAQVKPSSRPPHAA
jgi:hypothetical protein